MNATTVLDPAVSRAGNPKAIQEDQIKKLPHIYIIRDDVCPIDFSA